MGRWHAHGARRLGARLLAVADPDTSRARELAGSSVPVFANLSEMLESVQPDVLHLCSPSNTHGPSIRAAVDAGVHVFAEKPLAADADETRQLCDLAQQAGVVLCPVHQYAFQAAVAKILAQRERAGTLELVEINYYSAGAVGAPVENLPEIAADILPHPIAISQRLWPKLSLDTLDWSISPVGSHGWQMAAPVGPTLLRITVSLAARPTQATLTLWGSKGSWDADLFHGYARFRDGTASRRNKALRPFGDGFSMLGHASANLLGRALRREPAYPGLRTLMSEFFAAVSGTGPSPIPADQAIAVATLRDLFLAFTAAGQAGNR